MFFFVSWSSLRKSTQVFATYFHVCSVCFSYFFNVFVLFPRVPCGNLRKFCLGCCWCFARFFLQRCLTCRTSPAALFGSGLPPQVKETGGGSPGLGFQKMVFRVFLRTEFLTRFWSDFGLKKEVPKETKIVKKRSGNRFFSGLPFLVGFGTHLGLPTPRNLHFYVVK